MKEQIEVITYEQDRLNYFTDLMKKAQERYKRLFKKHKDAPYLSEEAQALSDAGRETHFLGDVVGMLEKGVGKQSEGLANDDELREIYESVKRYNKKTNDISHELRSIGDNFTGGSKVWLATDFFKKVVDLVFHANYIAKCLELVYQAAYVLTKSEVERLRSENADLQDALKCQVETNARLSGEYLSLMKESESQKAEIERLSKLNEEILMDHRFDRRPGGDCWNDVIEKAKTKVANEIFAEFDLHIRKAVEGWKKQLKFEIEKYKMDMIMARLDAFGYCIYVLNNLEQKYTEGETNGNKADTEI